MATHSSALAWKSPGQRSLVGCSPWGREESDTTERLSNSSKGILLAWDKKYRDSI